MKAVAATIWETMDDNERFGCRFGLFPVDKMEPLDALTRDDGHAVTRELMRLSVAMPEQEKPKRRLNKTERLLQSIITRNQTK